MSERRELYKALMPLAGVVIALLLLWSVLLVSPKTVQWPEVEVPAQSQTAVETSSTAASINFPVLQQYTHVWSEPLFNADRQADALNASQAPVEFIPPLDGLILTGIISTQQIKVALLKGSAGEEFSVKEGQALPNGWVLDRIDERHVELVYGGSRQSLEMPVPRLPMVFL